MNYFYKEKTYLIIIIKTAKTATVYEKMSTAEKFKRYLQRTGLDCKDYQVKGVEWCVEHETNGYKIQQEEEITTIEITTIKGGIIADEMGLGKTIQMLGTIVSNFKMQTLIVLPKALLEQWRQVIIKTLGHQPLMYHHFTSHKKKLEIIEKLKRSPIVLTTYGMIAINKKRKNIPNPLHHIEWDRVIYDEAHHLRNSSTGEYGGALKIKAQISWLVTGTPIQNKADDLYSLFDILKIPRKAYTKSEDALDLLVSQVILHRTKESVGLILPPLTIETHQVKWETNAEKKTARRYHKDISMCIAEAAAVAAADEEQLSMFLAMLRSRQTCILSALMEYNKLQYNIQKHIEKINSSKTNAVIEKIVERKDNGKKKIIFCHFRGEIDYIKAQLMTTHQIKVAVIDGRTPEGERREILQEAKAQAKQPQAKAQAKQPQAKQEEQEQQEQAQAQAEQQIQVLILQIQTGCEGLNLQTYSEVYFVSPHWNPAVEDQAIARCHRIGQKEETAVFRFQMDGFDEANMDQVKKTQSLDEYISSVQLLKREIVKQMLW